MPSAPRLAALVLLLALPRAAPFAPALVRPARAPRAACAMGMFHGGERSAFGAELLRLDCEGGAYLVGAQILRDRYKTLQDSWTVDDSLDELHRLCETAGLEVRGREYQSMQHPSPRSFIGSGKLDALVETVASLRVRTVVFDEELSPAQGRNIQRALDRAGGTTQVLDRTMLILFIFSQRARTREAKLQVAAAQNRYMLPRLTTFLTTGAGMDAKGGSSGGGGENLKGAGETQLEMDRRVFRKQLKGLEDELASVQAQRDAYRAKRRERDSRPLVAVVGYTNAGKSTLLNRLCGSDEVYADDLLFATLDPTSRLLALPGGKEILLSDTVGFIQKLPTKLVASFRATLDELADSTLVIHVVDASSPLATQQVRSVQNIVAELGAEGIPQVLALNKADLCGVAEEVDAAAALARTDWAGLYHSDPPCAICPISARDGRGVDGLLRAVEAGLLAASARVDLVLPYAEAALLAEAHKSGTITREDFTERGTHLVAHVPASLRNRLLKAVAAADAARTAGEAGSGVAERPAARRRS